jgi:hypothetical protein
MEDGYNLDTANRLLKVALVLAGDVDDIFREGAPGAVRVGRVVADD